MARPLFLPGDRPLLHLGLFVATLLSAFFVFWSSHLGFSDPWGAVAYSVAIVGILGCHEMGHYLFARRHGVDTTLPYFIPLPIPFGFGTLGAVIRIRSRIPSRNALVDIGAAGPLAGLAIAIPVLIVGLFLSRVDDAPTIIPRSIPGEWSLVVLLQQIWGSGEADESAGTAMRAITVYGDSLLMQGLQWLVLGPLPPGKEVFVHPLVIAGWFGMLVTMLNLCPIGQLDGGHLSFAWFGSRAVLVGRLAALGLLLLVLFFSVGWLAWLVITSTVIGFRHPEVINPDEPLSPRRRLICVLSLIALILCVVPIPLQQVPVP